jgi:hypothetical protein
LHKKGWAIVAALPTGPVVLHDPHGIRVLMLNKSKQEEERITG